MALAELGGAGQALAGLAFLSGAQVMADLVAKACSSPQTMEINAQARAGTLMKWVTIGLVEGAAFIGIAAMISPQVGMAFIAGGTLEGAITYMQYRHAKQSGLASDKPGTEQDAA
jgi:hypothetical protein